GRTPSWWSWMRRTGRRSRAWHRLRPRCRCETIARRRMSAGSAPASCRCTSPPSSRRGSPGEGPNDLEDDGMTRGNRGTKGWRAVLRLAVVLSSAAACGARAQVGASPPPAATLVQATAAPVKVAAGGVDTAIVHLVLLPGWHVNANPPALE